MPCAIRSTRSWPLCGPSNAKNRSPSALQIRYARTVTALWGSLMRLATACVICAGALEPGVRADCRYCGARCRMRAYRVRLDSGGCLRSDAQRRQVRTLRQRLQRDRESLNAERADFRQQQAEAAQRAKEQAEREETDRAAAAAQKQAAETAALANTQQLAAQAEKIAELEQQAKQRVLAYTALNAEHRVARKTIEDGSATIRALQEQNDGCCDKIRRLLREREQYTQEPRHRASETATRQQGTRIDRFAGAPPTGQKGQQSPSGGMPEDWRRRLDSLEGLTKTQAHTISEREQKIEALTTELSRLRQDSEQELTILHSSKRKAEQQAAAEIAKLNKALGEAQQEILKRTRELDEAEQQIAKWQDPVFRELQIALLKGVASGASSVAVTMLRQHLGLPEVLAKSATVPPSGSGSAVPLTAPSRQPSTSPPSAPASSAGVVPPASSMPPQPSPPRATHEGPIQRRYREAQEQARREQERQSRLKKP